MKRFKFESKSLLFLMICLSLLLLCSCSSNDDDASDLIVPQETPDENASNEIELPRPKAKWTFIEFMAGDESVDAFGFYDLMKLQAVGSSDNVHVVVQYDRSQYETTHYWNKAYGHWTDARRFYVQKKTGNSSANDFLVDKQDSIDYMKNHLSPETMGDYEFAKWVNKLENGNQEDLDEFTLDQLIKNLGRPLPDGFDNIGLQQKSIESAGEINTGDPDSLVDFVVWAIKNFPAEHYILSLFGHGTGWLGYGYDYSAGSIDYSNFDLLSLPDLDQAMNDIFQQTDISKFDLFIWHACLMGQLETISATSAYADYALASEEALDRAGWDYTAMLTKINDDPDVTPLELGKTLVNATYAYMSQPEHYVPDTSVFMYDLSKVQGVVDAVNNFVQSVSIDSMDELRNVALSRYDTPTFNQMDRGTSPIDLIDLMQRIASKASEPTKSLANTVINKVKDTIVVGGTNITDIYYGMSIYFPIDEDAYKTIYPGVGIFSTEYPLQVTNLNWDQFLAKYYEQIKLQLGNTKPEIKMVLDNSCSDRPYSFQNPPPVILTTSGKGLVNVQFSVFSQKNDNTYIEHSTDPIRYMAYKADKSLINIIIPENEMQNDFLWYAWVPSLADDQKQVQAALVTEASRSDQTKVYGLYHPKNGSDSKNVFLIVENKDGGKVLSMWEERGATEASNSYEMKPTPGDQFEPTFRQPIPGGLGSPLPLGERLTFSNKPFTVKYKAADKGTYKLQMRLQNLAGAISTSEISVEIDNTDPNLNTNYLGYNGLEIGASFLFPVDWNRLNISDESLEESVVLRIFVNADNTAEINVYSYTPGQSLNDETDDLIGKLISDSDVYYLSTVLSFDTHGNDNYVSEYTANKLSWKMDGKLYTTYIIHQPVTGQSNRFTLISSETDSESKAVLEKLMETLRFFDRVKLN